MRKEAFAGQFYPESNEELVEMLNRLVVSNKKEQVHAAVCPHAGYAFSGEIAGEIYSLIPEKKVFIILGVNHTGLGKKVCFSLDNWQTSLGEVKVNKDIVDKIMHRLKHEEIDCEINELVHQEEHSIEVQIPFLQHTQEDFTIVPIIFSDLNYEDCKKIAKILEGFVNDREIIIATSDMTHHGKIYGFAPFAQDIKNNLAKLDGDIILQVLRNDSKSFFHIASKSTVCGLYAVTILTEISKIRGWKARLTKYYTSGDVVNKWDAVVGYAGIVFE